MSGLQQKEVAKILGLKSPSSISEWEHGKRLPSLKNWIKLSIVYNTLMDNLFADMRREILYEVVDEIEKERKNKLK